MRTLLLFLGFISGTFAFAQTNVQGKVVDQNGQPVANANIVVIGQSEGAVADFDGNFAFSSSQTPPFSIRVSSLGYTTATLSYGGSAITVVLTEASTALDEIVISASRTPERIFESPVTVEKFGITQIANTPSADYFNGLENLRGIQLNQGGLLFNQVNTRGFGTVYNEGFVTLVDGMNNQAPVFGFAVGNLVGLNELDVQSIEVLPGAASALYGADALKGIMFLNSKNPFDHEGISAYYKTGITEQQAAGTNQFTDVAIRMATKLGDKWAIKATLSHKEGTDWAVNDYRHNVDGKIVDGYNVDNPDYNAVHKYGEVPVSSAASWDALYGLTQNPLLLQRKRHLQGKPEQHRPTDCPQWSPRSKHHKRKCNPADAVGGCGLIPRCSPRKHVPRSSKRHECPAHHRVHPANACHRSALRIDCGRCITSSAQQQPWPGAMHIKRRPTSRCPGEICKQVMTKHHWPDERQV